MFYERRCSLSSDRLPFRQNHLEKVSRSICKSLKRCVRQVWSGRAIRYSEAGLGWKWVKVQAPMGKEEATVKLGQVTLAGILSLLVSGGQTIQLIIDETKKGNLELVSGLVLGK